MLIPSTLDNSLASFTFGNPTAAVVVTGHTTNDNITFTAGGTASVLAGTGGLTLGGSITGLGTSAGGQSTMTFSSGTTTLTGVWGNEYFNFDNGATVVMNGIGTNYSNGGTNSGATEPSSREATSPS